MAPSAERRRAIPPHGDGDGDVSDDTDCRREAGDGETTSLAADVAGQFLTHMLSRHIRIEEDLLDQLFNSSEKRLARTLLLLARYGEPDAPRRTLSKISQETLAEMVGTTRSRVNFFLNKFRKLGLIEYNGELTVNDSLLSVVLGD